MEKKFNLVLDAKRTGFNTIRGLKQGDNNSVLNITLVQNGVPFELTGLTVRINYKRPDSKIFLQMADITNSTEGKIKINVLTQVLENVGEVKADLSIFDSNNRKITSVTFSMFVDGSIYRNDYIEPEDLDLIQSIWVEEDKRIKQEKDRQKNESDRQAAESVRQKTFEDNEVERKKVFEFTENERIKSEKDRQINEENRQEREITRENNEEIRVSTENQRVMAELLRKENEDKRKKNEVVREKNETIRESEFDGIKKEFGDLKNTATDENAVLKIDNQLQDLKEIIKSYTYDGSLGSEINMNKIITPDMETLKELLNDICKDIESIKKYDLSKNVVKSINGKTGSITREDIFSMEYDFYVDEEKGDDNNPGWSSKPLKTLSEALYRCRMSYNPYYSCRITLETNVNFDKDCIANFNGVLNGNGHAIKLKGTNHSLSFRRCNTTLQNIEFGKKIIIEDSHVKFSATTAVVSAIVARNSFITMEGITTVFSQQNEQNACLYLSRCLAFITGKLDCKNADRGIDVFKSSVYGTDNITGSYETKVKSDGKSTILN